MKTKTPTNLEFNLVEVTIKDDFYKEFQIWEVSKKIAENDENFHKVTREAYQDGKLLARAGTNVNSFAPQDWYLLTKKGAERPYSQAEQVNKINDHAIILQLLLNSPEFKYDDLGYIRDLDGFYALVEWQKSKKEIVTQTIRAISHRSSDTSVVLVPSVFSFRTQKEQIGAEKKNEPRSYRLCYSDKEITVYRGPLKKDTKNTVPWALAKNHRPSEAKNSYFEKVLAILKLSPFTKWLSVERKVFSREQIGFKNQTKKDKLYELLKLLGKENFSIAFANARSKPSQFNIIQAFQSFCQKENLPITVNPEVTLIDITDGETIQYSIEEFVSGLAANCFPIFFVDEKKDDSLKDQIDPKQEIDKILQDIPHHAIAKEEILEKTEEDESPEFTVILANLLIKKEVIEQKILLERFWYRDDDLFTEPCYINYLFCSEGKKEKQQPIYVATHIQREGTIEFFEEDRDFKLAEIANKSNWIQVWIDKVPEETASKYLVIKDNSVRVVPPVSSKREGWAETAGVYIVSDLSAYYASYSERPEDKISSGIVVREIEKASRKDLENIAKLCIDPSIRLSSATVVPAPFKHLKEWKQIKHPNSGTKSSN